MNSTLLVAWLIVFAVAGVTACVLLHKEQDTNNPAPAILIVLTLIFLPPIGLIATGVLIAWRRLAPAPPPRPRSHRRMVVAAQASDQDGGIFVRVDGAAGSGESL